MLQAMAVAVGFMGVRLISISLEVTTNPTFQQQHLSSSLEFQNRAEVVWKLDPMMKGRSFQEGLIYPEEEKDDESLAPSELGGLAEFTSSHNLLRSADDDDSLSRDFMLQYSKAMLVCGLLALCAVVFQFLCSCLLLCFINWDEKAPSQIWVAVNCSILFCLTSCLVLFLCEGNSIPAYSTDEKLFLALVTADTLLSIYFLFIVMAFI
ncbi:hypothetical protein Fcan01_08338 [Folsomia candida]|uniref:Uncharacterized protein n=1 Tax=Folsomia candida TaxID=158441 RepID=A0A226EH54_FOLCA|nr:hypothetical protein Fcan01_08338 [Folsomia candida]